MWPCMSSSFCINNFLFALTGRGPPGDASVCHPDRSAVRTPGGPGPDQGGLSQCLCRTTRYLGKAGARVFLGARQLGADLNSRRTWLGGLVKNFITKPPKSCTRPLLMSLKKVCWPAWESAELPLCDWSRAAQTAINWGTKGRGWCHRIPHCLGCCSRSTALLARGRLNAPQNRSLAVTSSQVWF